MRSFFLFFFFCCCISAMQAQDSTLNEYVGKYNFPDGSFVTSADVVLKDTILNISSPQGASDLVKRGRDTFALLNYDGTVYFKRNSSGKVSGIKVAVEDQLAEGSKDGATAWLQKKQPAPARKRVLVK